LNNKNKTFGGKTAFRRFEKVFRILLRTDMFSVSNDEYRFPGYPGILSIFKVLKYPGNWIEYPGTVVAVINHFDAAYNISINQMATITDALVFVSVSAELELDHIKRTITFSVIRLSSFDCI
jgi:hypothetical protein